MKPVDVVFLNIYPYCSGRMISAIKQLSMAVGIYVEIA